MENNKRPLTVSEVTIDRVLSHYLWNRSIPPRKEDMATAVTQAERTPINIDAADYMQNGPGRYVSAANFKMFEKFFKAANLPAREKPYSFEEAVYLIYNEADAERVKSLPYSNRGFTTSASHYSINPSSDDYVERAFIFGSTEVTITEADIRKLQFIVNSDGSREIRNLRITPVKDDFDFKGGTSAQDWRSRVQKWGIDKVNSAFKATLDPQDIGKTVPIEYVNTENLKFVNITDTEFKRLQSEKSRREISDAVIEETGIPFVTKSGELLIKLMNSPARYDSDDLQLKNKQQSLNHPEQPQYAQNQLNQPYQYAQTDVAKPSLRIEDMPPHIRTLFNDNKALLTEFCRDECIAYPENKTDNIAMAMTAACIANRMPRASLIDIEHGEISIAYDAVDFRETAVMMDKAAATPVSESMNQIVQTEQMFEQQRQLAQSQSYGISRS